MYIYKAMVLQRTHNASVNIKLSGREVRFFYFLLLVCVCEYVNLSRVRRASECVFLRGRTSSECVFACSVALRIRDCPHTIVFALSLSISLAPFRAMRAYVFVCVASKYFRLFAYAHVNTHTTTTT